MASVISPGLAPAQAAAVEGIARIVRVEPGCLWLEPEQTTSCGHCASNASCSMSESREAPGMGTVASRLVARRFSLPEREAGGFVEGERVVVGVAESALLKAALTAYGLPLLSALLGGGLAQGRYGEDGAAMLGVLAGFAIGFALARMIARQLAARGQLAPRLLRRARPDETCSSL